jgi:cell division protein FtsQ
VNASAAIGWLRRPWFWGVVVLVTLGAAATALRFAPFFEVEQITVAGNEQVTEDEVRAAASVAQSAALLTVPVDEVAERIESLDAVASARVMRDWPDTVRIVVKERRPVGYVTTGSTVLLVGSDAVLYRAVDDVPRDLPQLPFTAVDAAVGDSYGSSSDTTTSAAADAAFTVATALPPGLRRAIESISVGDDADVQVTFADGVVVDWGSSTASDRKAEVVALLRGRGGWGRTFQAVDVSVPEAPALRDTPIG